MWINYFRLSKNRKDIKEKSETHEGLNVNEEYLSAIRTNSYGEFLAKAQSLVRDLSFSSSYSDKKFSEVLLKPAQDSIPTMLESAKILSKIPELKGLILNFFDLTAEGSRFCSHILKNIKKTQSNYEFIQQILDFVDTSPPPKKIDLIASVMSSFVNQTNPFSSPSKAEFERIHNRYSSVLHALKLRRTKVAKKIKIISCIQKSTGVCITAACGLIAIATIAIAAHTITGLIMGPAIFSFPVQKIKEKLISFKFFKSTRFLTRIGQQLDAAAKGIYILKRDFDTISRIVDRVRDEIDHKKEMIKFCLMRSEGNCKFAMQVVNEIKKSSVGLRKQVQDLEEHVYLCLVTINRARALIVKEITTLNSEVD